MLSTAELQNILKKVSYKPGWSFEIYDGEWEGQHLRITTVVPNAYSLNDNLEIDVHSVLPPIPDEQYFHIWLMKRLARIEVHEMREFYRVDGKIVDDPHRDGADQDRPL